MAIGVFRFDNPAAGDTGWASVAGAPVFRFNTTGDLDSGHVWISDIGYLDFQRRKMWNSAHVRRSDFMRVKPASLAGELALDYGTSESLEALSAIYDRVAQLVENRLGESMPAITYTVPHALKHIDFPPPGKIDVAHTDALDTAISQSTQEVQRCGGRMPVGAKIIQPCFPRVAYARYLLSRPLPDTGQGWAEAKIDGKGVKLGLSRGKVMKGTPEWLAAKTPLLETHAMFLKVRVLETSPAFASHGEFGSGFNAGNRMWATLPEIFHLANYCLLEVRSGYFCPARRFDVPDAVRGNTVSEGLLAENLWVAQTLNTHRDKGLARGAYIRAYDRVACANAVLKLTALGYRALSYGSGRIVLATSGPADRISQHLLEAGLIPPAC